MSIKLKCGYRARIVNCLDAEDFVGREGTIVSTWGEGRESIGMKVDGQPASSTYWFRPSEVRNVK